MKTQRFLFFIILLTCFLSCEKDETENITNGVTFRQFDIESNTESTITNTFVEYEEIIGYDSTKHVFVLTDLAWGKIEKGILPSYPDPHFGFIVALDNELIYRVAFIQSYSSIALFDIITLRVTEPNMVFMDLGYPASPSHFIGEDLRNDSRLIDIFKKDSKLIEIEN